MDNKKIVEGMKKLRDAIEEFVDNIEIDEADESFKKKDPKKSEKDKEMEDE